MNLEQYNKIVGSTAQEFAETGLNVHQLFPWQIRRMNEMYDLPINISPSLDELGESPLQRMQGFMKTLQKEMDEGQEIMALLHFREKYWDAARECSSDQVWNFEEIESTLLATFTTEARAQKLAKDAFSWLCEGGPALFDSQILVMIADWLGDMTVYNRSEALKYGIPLESVLACLMGSNFTKLGEDGLPIKDEDGKVQKGPNFMPPEEAIYATMFEQEQLVHEAQSIIEAADTLSTVALPILQDPMAEVLLAGEEHDGDDYMLPPDEEGADEEWA